MYKKIEDPDYSLTTGTSYKGLLIDTTYFDLVQAFGDPTFSEPSGDNKVQKEWVFKDCDGNVFTIYDWKTYDEEVTTSRLEVWHVGGKKYAGNFIEWVEVQVNNVVKV